MKEQVEYLPEVASFRGNSPLFDAKMRDIGCPQSPYKPVLGTEKDDMDGETVLFLDE